MCANESNIQYGQNEKSLCILHYFYFILHCLFTCSFSLCYKLLCLFFVLGVRVCECLHECAFECNVDVSLYKIYKNIRQMYIFEICRTVCNHYISQLGFSFSFFFLLLPLALFLRLSVSSPIQFYFQKNKMKKNWEKIKTNKIMQEKEEEEKK